MGIGEIRWNTSRSINLLPSPQVRCGYPSYDRRHQGLTASLTLDIPGYGPPDINQLGILPDPSIGPFAAGGDSGSLIMSKDNY